MVDPKKGRVYIQQTLEEYSKNIHNTKKKKPEKERIPVQMVTVIRDSKDSSKDYKMPLAEAMDEYQKTGGKLAWDCTNKTFCEISR